MAKPQADPRHVNSGRYIPAPLQAIQSRSVTDLCDQPASQRSFRGPTCGRVAASGSSRSRRNPDFTANNLSPSGRLNRSLVSLPGHQISPSPSRAWVHSVDADDVNMPPQRLEDRGGNLQVDTAHSHSCYSLPSSGLDPESRSCRLARMRSQTLLLPRPEASCRRSVQQELESNAANLAGSNSESAHLLSRPVVMVLSPPGGLEEPGPPPPMRPPPPPGPVPAVRCKAAVLPTPEVLASLDSKAIEVKMM
ncbi:unnamed protein product [Protopolystoma xenopodis]|uniref:Uncharacterized protein n=1 Tax=Protopolystoma xenopodis TaxID=117903 RepID=A0A448WZW6_9PLAT|nr:unnamed protein product [Protopolystoma xenopodis]